MTYYEIFSQISNLKNSGFYRHVRINEKFEQIVFILG